MADERDRYRKGPVPERLEGRIAGLWTASAGELSQPLRESVQAVLEKLDEAPA